MIDLEDQIVALSISDAPDRDKLGFPRREIERVVFSMCGALVRAGAKILYTGDLRPEGWTFKIFQHLAGAYAGQGVSPFLHLVPEPVLRRTSFEALQEELRICRGVAETALIVGDQVLHISADAGLRVDAGTDRVRLSDQLALDRWLSDLPEAPGASGYTTARQVASNIAAARIVMGGKMGILSNRQDLYEGSIPGIIEEAILTLITDKPLIIFGAFGGAARDLAIALGLLGDDAAVPRDEQLDSYRVSIELAKSIGVEFRDDWLRRLKFLANEDRSEHLARETVLLISDAIRSRSYGSPFQFRRREVAK